MSIPTALGVRATAVPDSAAAAQALTSVGYITYSDTGHMGERLILTPAPADGSGRVRSF